MNWLLELIGGVSKAEVEKMLSDQKEIFEQTIFGIRKRLQEAENFSGELAWNIANHSHGEAPPEEPPPGEPFEWDRKGPKEYWPKKVAGLPVGYVKVSEEKSPLRKLIPNPDNKDGTPLPVIYENDDLRPGNTTDDKRIIAKAGNWFMVAANGDNYKHGSPRPFGEKINGDDLFYKVMHEQVIDGINLSEVPSLPEVYLLFQHIGETYMP